MFFVAALTAAALAGCAKEEDFDAALLTAGTGEWSYTHDYGNGPQEIHNVFRADGSGTNKYVEPYAPDQRFTWTLEGNTLTFINIETRGIAAPDVCTVTTLTETKLIYISHGTTFDCTKVQ